jgi:hypothetical protein
MSTFEVLQQLNDRIVEQHAIIVEQDDVLTLVEFREREPLQDGDPEEVLAPHKVKNLQVLIRKGAKDLDQDWKNAIHLCNKAYKVAGHQLPLPHMKDGWEQYEYLLSFTVGVLSNTRGPDAKWRSTESKDHPSPEDEAVERTLRKVPGYLNSEELPTHEKAIEKQRQEEEKRKRTNRLKDA